MKKTFCLLLALLFAFSCSFLTVFASSDEEEAASDEHSVSILGFNEVIPPFELDTENQLAGSGCLTLTLQEGGSDMFIASWQLPEPLDLRAYDTIEFDLYVSDAAYFDIAFPDSQFELSSSGTCDSEEICFIPAHFAAGIEGDPNEGWNHVVLPLVQGHVTGGEPDYSHINFFRFYAVNIPLPTEPLTIKIDNLRATDAYSGTAAQMRELCAPVVEMIGKIDCTEISAENYETVKSSLEEAKKAFRDLPDAAQSMFDDDAYTRLSELNSMILRYEQNLKKETTPAVTEAPETDTSANTAETAGADESGMSGEKKGCGSAVSCAAVLVLLLAAAPVIKRR